MGRLAGLLWVIGLCLVVCACSLPDETTAPDSVDRHTSTSAISQPAVTRELSVSSSAASSRTSTSTVTSPSVSSGVTTASPGSAEAKAPFAVPSPFTDKKLVSITLKENPNAFSPGQHTLTLNVITDPIQLADIQAILVQKDWTVYPSLESGWLKCWPVYASRALICELEGGDRVVLHLFYDASGFAATAVLDAAVSYEAFASSAVQAYRDGNHPFTLYTIPSGLGEQLQQLYPSE